MARGKKTDYKTIYKVMTSWFATHNYEEVARQLKMPPTTVKEIVKANKDKDEFVELRRQKQDEFADKASVLIDKILERINNEIDDCEKDIPLNHLTTAMGTLYDKRALSQGDLTQNVGFATNFDLDKLLDISGYTKKDDSQ